MNRTSADDVIIQLLCPGPEVVVSALGAPLVTYASRSATRVARSVGAGGAVCACAIAVTATVNVRAKIPTAVSFLVSSMFLPFCRLAFLQPAGHRPATRWKVAAAYSAGKEHNRGARSI